jgi:hypothetical protein
MARRYDRWGFDDIESWRRGPVLGAIDFHIQCLRPSDEIQSDLTGLMVQEAIPEFAREVDRFFGGMVEARLYSIESGSIWGTVLLVLASGATFYEFVSKYKDFREGLLVLRQDFWSLTNRVVQGRLAGLERRPEIHIDVTATPWMAVEERTATPERVPWPLRSPVLNALIWYLLATNVLLLGAAALLVLQPVATMVAVLFVYLLINNAILSAYLYTNVLRVAALQLRALRRRSVGPQS